MLVLDYVRRTEPDGLRPEIVVPRFHAGHLGFIPGTRVYLGLTEARGQSPELLITPIHALNNYLVALSATVKDQPGVVRDLLQLVAGHGYNVEVQESSSIDSMEDHRVDLIIRMPRSKRATPPSVRRAFEPWRANVPTDDWNCIALFAEIVEHFGDWLVSREVGGEHVLDLSIRPLPDARLENAESTLIVVSPDKQHISVPIPDALSERLFDLMPDGERDEGRMYYVYSSDTKQRNIRVAFLPAHRARSLVHLGFAHRDRPDELRKLMDAVEDAGFNIVTSLLRKHTRELSVWEAILESEDGDPPPADFDDPAADYKNQVIPWVLGKLSKAAEAHGQLTPKQVSVGPPLYPPKFGGNSNLKGYLKLDWTPSQKVRGPRTKKVRSSLPGDNEEPRVDELRAVAKQFLTRSDKPKLFLSYPQNAVEPLIDGELRAKLGAFEVLDSNGTRTTNVLDQIAECDYFVGVWHPDRFTDVTILLSPWLPYEYMAAASHGIPRCLAVHKEFSAVVRDRLDSGMGHIDYGDADFDGKLVTAITNYCQRHFR